MTPQTAPAADPGKAGYALPAVLAVLAVLTLVFISAMTALKSLGDEARSAVEAADFERLAMTAEAHSAWLVTTEPLSQDRLRVGGLRVPPGDIVSAAPYLASPSTPLMIDGRAYAWSAPAGDGASPGAETVSLQDEAGLLNLDYSRQDTLERLFLRAGADNGQAATLADELLDDIDADDVRRTDGAETAEYVAASRPPPLNAPLYRADQVFGVLDWRRIMTPARWRRVVDLVVVDPAATSFNVNTAPEAVLELVLNLTPERARAIVAQREAAPISSITQIGLPAGDGSVTYVFPDGRFRFTLRDARRGLSYTSSLELTPENLTRPLWIDAGTPRRSSSRPEIDLGALPRFPDPVGRSAGP